MNTIYEDDIKAAVRDQYGKIADSGSCGCTPSACCSPEETEITAKSISGELGYSDQEMSSIPEGSNLGLGCGNPQGIASIREGETVLDLGSGAGFDCFLASQSTGRNGKVIGVDMTPQMISKARKNALDSGIKNVEFRLGEIENLPVSDESVDVIISNCVVNLSPDKNKVFREAYRVLKKGGRIAISDIVASNSIPGEYKKDISLLTGCMSGASTIEDLETILKEVGFQKIKIEPKQESKKFIATWTTKSQIIDYVVSANIQAIK